MIAKVVRGWRPGGLVAYLFGPGLYEEHRDPRVVASWDGAPWLHQPDKLPPVVLDGEIMAPGEFDFDLRPLITTMQELAQAAGLPTTTPPALPAVWAKLVAAGVALPPEAPEWARHYRYDPRKKAVVLKQGYVWHCPVRLHPDDPILSDEQWQYIAHRLMRATGIDRSGCRWIAVRHADDHIHLVVTLVSERTGAQYHPYRDFRRLRAACQQLEREFGLVATAGIDATAAPAPTRAEKGKAERHGRTMTAREELRRLVGHSAATARDGEQFVAALRRDGLDSQTVRGPDGLVRGYTVALPGDLTADGAPVRYSGSALAPDLTWPKLATRWATAASAPPNATTHQADRSRGMAGKLAAALNNTTAMVERAVTGVRGGEDVDTIAHATGEILAVVSRGREGRALGPLGEITARFDRATRTPHRVVPVDAGALARELRGAARQLGAVGVLSGRGDERLATVALLLAMGSLVAEIAAWQQRQGRVHQAAAARTTAHALTTVDRTGTDRRSSARPAPQPAPAARPAVVAARPGSQTRPRGRQSS